VSRPDPLRVAFVTGTTPDRWARRWREQRPRHPLELVPVVEADQERVLRDREVDMALVRLPVHREGLHLVRLYEEVQVVVAGRDHWLAAGEEVTLADLADEQLVAPHRSGWTPGADQLDWPAMDERASVATVAAGTGVVLLPMSVARLYHRRDVVVRPVPELEGTTVGLAWPVERDDETTQAFVGVVRGRTSRSSRG
jgi:DNA-binding transcriptional LysR family regulator